MKILFAGSSLYGSSVALDGLVVRPPAKQGDVLAAVRDGATAIGLIDGEFGQHAAVWHKEILFALHQGVAMFGASSMGALRAAECAAYGMVPVGRIAQAYADGTLDDDAAVALLMLPPEMGSAPASEPLVDAEATIEALATMGLVDADTKGRLLARARSLHFSERTDKSILAGEPDAAGLLAAYRRHHVDLKRLDAEALVEMLRAYEPPAEHAPPAFVLADSPYWTIAFAELRGGMR